MKKLQLWRWIRWPVLPIQRSKRSFGEYAEVVGYSVRDGSAAGVLPRADLFAISTDAYGSAEEEARHVPIDSQIMSIEVTFYWETLKKLFEIPQGTKCCL